MLSFVSGMLVLFQDVWFKVQYLEIFYLAGNVKESVKDFIFVTLKVLNFVIFVIFAHFHKICTCKKLKKPTESQIKYLQN